MSRFRDLIRFYDLLETLGDCTNCPFGDAALPTKNRGVYFFFEPGEFRSDSGKGLRVVRVGTHALKVGSSSTLGGRLKQHRGTSSGGGNHRGSIFRLLVGGALLRRGDCASCVSWGVKGDVSRAIAHMNSDRATLVAAEAPIERTVSDILGAMFCQWVSIDDAPTHSSLRGFIERNSIALLSNHQRSPLDQASKDWLGSVLNKDSRPY